MNFNMQGRNAAIIAEGAYAVAAATERTSVNVKRDADTFAKRESSFNATSETEPSLSVAVTPLEAVVSQSGAIVKEKAGFGVLLERHGSQKGEFVFAMRGTVGETKFSPDWLSNYNIGMTRGPTGTPVHSGFMSIYEAMRRDVRSMIAGARPERIHFVGHSLGGALATLAALDHAKTGTATTHLYTFGAPRIGTLGIGGDINRYIGTERVKRIYALSDPVPMMPLFPFCHAGAGATGIIDGFDSITDAAHSMRGCYIKKMDPAGWPPAVRRPTKADPEYWLQQAEAARGIGSTIGYYCLGKALQGIMPILHMLCGGVSVMLTTLDLLSEGIRRAIQISKEIGGFMLRFVKSALRFTVGVASSALSVADLTASFLRYVLGLMMQQVGRAAQAAINKMT